MDIVRWCRNEWERSLAVVAIGGGLVAFFLGWLGQRNKALVAEQIPYVVSGAMFGILLIIVGTTVWLSADLRDEWVKLDRVEDQVAQAVTLLEAGSGRTGSTTGSHRGQGTEPFSRSAVEAQR